MKTIPVLLCLLILVSCGSDQSSKPGIKHHSDEIVIETETHDYLLTTSYTEEIIGLQVWQIKQKEKKSDQMLTLFTVQRIWQESEPGPPSPVTSDTDIVFQDKSKSYIYSVLRQDFIENKFPHLIYKGNYKKK